MSQHGRTPITWLVGAGFSQGAGLPLSQEVWQLLAISWQRDAREWRERREAGRGERSGGIPDLMRLCRDAAGHLPVPADGGEPRLREELLRALAELRDRAAPVQRESLTQQDAVYETIFQLAAPTPEGRRRFLSTLLGARVAGPGLCHLLLGALLLWERGPRMHTVFTVGFDDLLQEALLWLRRQVRVFGDPQGRDRPLLWPPVAQVVHLHGRVAGYLPPPAETAPLCEAFYEHLRESSLIVCGYRGADERVMATVRRWLKGGEMSGQLYWVLHHEDRAGEIAARLAGLDVPAGRVRLVCRPAGSGALSADEVLVALWAQLLPRAGGDLSGLIRDIAQLGGGRLQHALSRVCRDFPQHDPVALHLRARHEHIGTSERQRHLLRAEELAAAAGVPEWQAQVQMAEMREHFGRGDLASAQRCAEAARAAVSLRKDTGLLRAQTSGLCGELALWLGQLEVAQRHLRPLCMGEGVAPPEWREEARHLLLDALLRAARTERVTTSSKQEEIRELLELPVSTPVSSVRCLIVEAELYFISGDVRRAVLLYESADEVAGRHMKALIPAGPTPLLGPTDGLLFAGPAPGEAEQEAALIRCARQARAGLLLCRALDARDQGVLPTSLLRDIDDYTGRYPPPEGDVEGHLLAATLYALAVELDPIALRRADEHAQAALGALTPYTPPWRVAHVLRCAGRVALLAGRLEDAERNARRGQRAARQLYLADEEAAGDLLLGQIHVERARRQDSDGRAFLLRRAVAHAEAAWLRAIELGSTWLKEEADDLLSTLRPSPVEVASADDMTPVPRAP